jgi:hypothetical protein
MVTHKKTKTRARTRGGSRTGSGSRSGKKGLKQLNVTLIKKYIGKTLKLYAREYLKEPAKKSDWSNPKNKPTHYTLYFKPLKVLDDMVEGDIQFYHGEPFNSSSLQVDRKNKNISTNLMNTQVFIMV